MTLAHVLRGGSGVRIPVLGGFVGPLSSMCSLVPSADFPAALRMTLFVPLQRRLCRLRILLPLSLASARGAVASPACSLPVATFCGAGLGGLNVVKACVFALAHQLQVLKAVVPLIPILVMDDVPWGNRAMRFLPDLAMNYYVRASATAAGALIRILHEALSFRPVNAENRLPVLVSGFENATIASACLVARSTRWVSRRKVVLHLPAALSFVQVQCLMGGLYHLRQALYNSPSSIIRRSLCPRPRLPL